MNKYIGKICPFCKTEFQENDEIVICSSCDMPHHKDCWIENQGCTTFGCMGTIMAANDVSNTVTATEISFDEAPASFHTFCTRCGTRNVSGFAFCTKCGNSLRATSSAPVYVQSNPANTNPYAYIQQNYNAQPTHTPPYQQNNSYTQNNTYIPQNYYPQSNVVDSDVAALVGTNQAYYIPKFQEMKAQNKKTSWNWVAFFFTPYWFMYRKMYGYGFASLGVMFLFNLINIPVISLLSLGGYITIGLFANYIYMKWIENNANHSKTMNEPLRTQFIQKNGGTSSTALVLTIVGWAVLIGFIYAM